MSWVNVWRCHAALLTNCLLFLEFSAASFMKAGNHFVVSNCNDNKVPFVRMISKILDEIYLIIKDYNDQQLSSLHSLVLTLYFVSAQLLHSVACLFIPSLPPRRVQGLCWLLQEQIQRYHSVISKLSPNTQAESYRSSVDSTSDRLTPSCVCYSVSVT